MRYKRMFYCTALQSSMDLKSNKEKGNFDSFPFPLFAVCTVEIRKPIALCLDVKVIMNALYANVPNLFVRKMT